MNITCFECGKPIDVLKEPHRSMNVYHEKDNPHQMTIHAHEYCIVGSPNASNWRNSLRVGVTTIQEVKDITEKINKIAEF